ncbi:MAG: hypothetical protein QOI01_2741 [Mycobacterium sp.]|jgi:hypothetical protein|nr:hypothetical protein [Mycobacterium sp.]
MEDSASALAVAEMPPPQYTKSSSPRSRLGEHANEALRINSSQQDEDRIFLSASALRPFHGQ